MNPTRIRAHILANAIKHNGKAAPKAIIGSLLHEDSTIRAKLKTLMPTIEQLTKDVNTLTLDQQRNELEKLAPELLIKKEKQTFPDLPNAQHGSVVTRIPPDPSKYLHAGHALSFIINAIYAQKYAGRVVLRFEDTNPETAQQEYVDTIKEDVTNYLAIPITEEISVSDDLDKIISAAKQLHEQSDAYICTCDRQTMQDNRHKGLVCEHREQTLDWNTLANAKEGQAILRIKLDMQHKNQALRDPVLLRISDTPHYKHGTSHRLYPLYDLANVLEDHWTGVTHILRSNEFGQMRIDLQNAIREKLNLPEITTVQYGRFNVATGITKGREIRDLIEQGDVTGWDDPRLMTLRALQRRGILKDTFYRLAEEVGLTANQTTIDWKTLATINRQLLDPTSRRFFFIWNPVAVQILNAPSHTLELDFHPDKKGGRHFTTADTFYLTKTDYEDLEAGKLYRLMNNCNFTKQDDKLMYHSLDIETYKASGHKIMHWLPQDHLIGVSVLTPDGWIEGYGEHTLHDVSVGETIQFERFGFCRCDKIENNHYFFVFGHK